MNSKCVVGPLTGRIILLVIILVFVCVLVALGQELSAAVMALGGISAAVFAITSGQLPTQDAGGA